MIRVKVVYSIRHIILLVFNKIWINKTISKNIREPSQPIKDHCRLFTNLKCFFYFIHSNYWRNNDFQILVLPWKYTYYFDSLILKKLVLETLVFCTWLKLFFTTFDLQSLLLDLSKSRWLFAWLNFSLFSISSPSFNIIVNIFLQILLLNSQSSLAMF